MQQQDKRVWTTKEQGTIPMSSMTNEHLQAAFMHCNNKILLYHNASSKLDKLQDQLLEVAKERGIELKYVDELYPNKKKWKKFYSNIRKTKEMTSVVVDLKQAEEVVLNGEEA